jgi:zinc transport system ATP-binding protein
LDNVLDVEHLSVRFGDNQVLNDLSFQVVQGSSLAIIGPNGVGKTVLLQALLGWVPSSGSVHWANGVRFGYVPQKLDIDRDVPITGMDFLAARASLTRDAGHAADPPIAHILDLVGIPAEASQKMIGTLSGGQFQRLLLAFALLGDPTVLMLDEPTAGIDQPGQKRLNELIRRLQQERGITVLFISHELSVVYDYATEVLCLGHGKACIGPPRKILTPALLNDIYGTAMDYHIHGR